MGTQRFHRQQGNPTERCKKLRRPWQQWEQLHSSISCKPGLVDVEIGIHQPQAVKVLIAVTDGMLRAATIRMTRLISQQCRRGTQAFAMQQTFAGLEPFGQIFRSVIAGVVLVKTAKQTLDSGVGLHGL